MRALHLHDLNPATRSHLTTGRPIFVFPERGWRGSSMLANRDDALVEMPLRAKRYVSSRSARHRACALVRHVCSPNRDLVLYYCGFQISWRGGFFRYSFRSLLYFLSTPRSTFNSPTTQRTRSIFMALESRRQGLSINVEFFSKF